MSRYLVHIIFFMFSNGALIAQSDTLNQTDANGLKQGHWIVYGKDMPDKGFCDTCKIEEGRFIDSKKNGQWILYNKNGQPRTLGHFVNGRPLGYYEKYDTLGRKIESGNYKNGKQVGFFERYYDSGCLAQQKLYDSTGREVYVYLYNDDCKIDTSNIGSVLIRDKVNVYQNKEYPMEITYGMTYGQYPDDTHVSGSKSKSDSYLKKSNYNNCDSTFVISDSTKLIHNGPNGATGWTKGKPFKSNGYNKVYNEDQELWLDGIFKDGKLWKGKYYIYDKDGILLKIEIWCNGSYCCDGSL